MTEEKIILDPSCGSRMFWFNKQHPNVLYTDIRNEQHVLCDGRQLVIQPDMIVDYRNMPFADGSFNLVVFDPSHFDKLGANSWMGLKYGVLGKDWQTDLKKGFDECMRVLKPMGVLIIKWNEAQIQVAKLIKVFGSEPLFGHTTGRSGKTIWMCYMKINN